MRHVELAAGTDRSDRDVIQRGHKGMDQDQGFDVGENVEKGTQKRPLEGVR